MPVSERTRTKSRKALEAHRETVSQLLHFKFRIAPTLSPGPLRPRCGKDDCMVRHNLFLCTNCQAIQYCSSEHQEADKEYHCNGCSVIKQKREGIANLKQRLENLSAVGLQDLHSDPFHSAVGNFCVKFPTRVYMFTKEWLVEALLKANTYVAVKEALEQSMDMLRRCRADSQGMRNYIPFLMLRLGLDQECYDFFKWWQTGCDSQYDWIDMSLPYLNIHNADTFEPVQDICGIRVGLCFIAAITILKINLVRGVKWLQNSNVLLEKFPQEIVVRIQRFIPLSGTIYGSERILFMDPDKVINMLLEQAEVLFTVVHNTNEFYWSTFLRPGIRSTVENEPWYMGDLNQTKGMLQYRDVAWIETPEVRNILLWRLEKGRWNLMH